MIARRGSRRASRAEGVTAQIRLRRDAKPGGKILRLLWRGDKRVAFGCARQGGVRGAAAPRRRIFRVAAHLMKRVEDPEP